MKNGSKCPHSDSTSSCYYKHKSEGKGQSKGYYSYVYGSKKKQRWELRLAEPDSKYEMQPRNDVWGIIRLFCGNQTRNQ